MHAKIERFDITICRVPTDFPESDGTLEWDATVMDLVQIEAGGKKGLGYTYAPPAVAEFIGQMLGGAVRGQDAMDIPRIWERMVLEIRNAGRPGIASMAIAAVDTALWDLKARLLNVPLVKLLGGLVAEVPVYGSGGFTSYSNDRLQQQFSAWIGQGIRSVKMKVGREPDRDVERVAVAREAIGEEPELFVDANGAFHPKKASAMAEAFADYNVTWFEEPVSSDDLAGLAELRRQAPPGMDIAAGEYGYDLYYFKRMLEAQAVDVLQVDITRCGGLTEFLRASALAAAYHIPLSTHTAPQLHLHAAASVPSMRHIEYFHDHVRIEEMFFDGVITPVAGKMAPDLSRPGHGLELKQSVVAKYAL